MPNSKTETRQEITNRLNHWIDFSLADLVHTDPSAALSAIDEHYQTAVQLNDSDIIVQLLRQKGICNINLSRFVNALTATHQALEVLMTLGSDPRVISCQIDIGLSYYHLGDFPDALEWFETALANSRKYDRQRGIFFSLSNIRDVEVKLGNLEQALSYGQDCLILALEINDGYEIANAQADLGVTYVKLGQKNSNIRLNQAAEQFRTAIDLFKQARASASTNQTHVNGLEVNTLNTQAVALAELGQIENAFIISDQALEVASKDNNPAATADSEKTRGWLLNKTGQTAKAIAHFEIALEIYQQIGTKEPIANVHHELAEARKAFGQHAQAYEHLAKYHDLDVQLRSETAERRAQAFAAKLDLEKAHLEAQMHRIRSEELSELNQQLREQAVLLDKMAREDELTGMPNRRRLDEFAQVAFKQARATNTPLTIAVADLDFFKQVNDLFGHSMGDTVMRILGQMLSDQCPESGLVARYGGEEFVLILPNTTLKQAGILCEEIRFKLQNHNWYDLHPKLAVTISIGMSDDQTALNYERLLSLADLQLYKAKDAGRNCVHPNLDKV